MFKIQQLYLLLTLLFVVPAIAQKDSLVTKKNKKNQFFKKMIVPVGLITVGSILSGSKGEINIQNDIRKGVGKGVSTRLDDYFRYGPMTELAIANAIGLTSKNHWFDQAKNLFIIDVASFITVRSLKSIVQRSRPNNMYIYNSFPSGHTTLAFSNASMLYYEYKEHHPVFAYSGYAFAMATGTLRVLNDRHWIGDVLVGAGMGMLITHLVYKLEPLKNWNPFRKSKHLSFGPVLNRDELMIRLNWRF